jgi:curved DNA-binding protein CbpA
MLQRENIIMDYPQTSKNDRKEGQTLVSQQSVEFNPYNFNESLEKIELEMEKEVDEFEQEQERRRIQFEKNRKHKKEYLESQINKFESQYNPWELLGLHQDDYSIPNIKKAYKKNALKYHPDRAGKKYEDRFQLITQAYIYLLNKAEESDHLEQKMSRHVEKIDYENDANEQVENIYVDKDNFDLNKFNKIFDKYKIPDSFDDGYADLMKKDFDKNSQNQIENNDNKIFGKKFNNDIFNSHFDNLKTKKSNEIIEYIDPSALEASSNVSRGLLGVSKVEDFGTVNSGNLSYTDYKKAHFEENLLIDVNKVKYTNHKSIDDLEQERSRLSYVATSEDKKRYDLLEQRRMEEDRQREMQQKQYDTMIQNQYHKLNKKLIVHK